MDSRLQTIINFVPINKRVADIGTDHGYLSIELIKKNISSKVIATDKNLLPLQAARKNIKSAQIEDKIELRLGEGLKPLKVNEVDVICIAGLGGSLICEILNESPEIISTTEKIILQPMNGIEKVHQWTLENNFYVEDEDLAEVDEIIYEIICLSRNKNNKKSKRKLNSPLYKKFIELKINKLEKIIESMNRSQRAIKSEKYFEITNQIKEMRLKVNEKSYSPNGL